MNDTHGTRTKILWIIFWKRRRGACSYQIKTPVVEPQNEFTVTRAPIVPDEIEVQLPVKFEFSEIFDWEQFDGGKVVKGDFYYLFNRL